MMRLVHWLHARSIWAAGAIPPEEWKYRNLKRVALPVYDGFAVLAGLAAITYGSRLLNRIFTPELLDIVGLGFSVVALVCLLGVAFPCLWAVEMIGKAVLVGMVIGYQAAVVLYPTPVPAVDDVPNWFVVCMLGFGLPLACWRLSVLGEEWWTRRAPRRQEGRA